MFSVSQLSYQHHIILYDGALYDDTLEHTTETLHQYMTVGSAAVVMALIPGKQNRQSYKERTRPHLGQTSGP